MATTQKTKELLYIGTYTEMGEGIYLYEFDRATRSFKELQIVPNKNSPSFLAFHLNKEFLYSANEANGTVSSYSVDRGTGKLTAMNTVSSHGEAPCHVSIDPSGRYLYISNYSSGSFTVYRINQDGHIGALIDIIQNKGSEGQTPHMHSIIPSADGRFIYASDLGIDRILIYQVDSDSGKLTPGQVPYVDTQKGDGPRHFVIDPKGNFAYSAGELSSVVNVFRISKENGGLTPVQRISMLPEAFSGKSYAADIHMSSDGKFLYASNRGHDSIVMYAVDQQTGELQIDGHTYTHGKHPRNFSLDKTESLVFVANRDNNNIVIFDRDKITGELSYSGQELSVPTPVYVKLVALS